MNHQKIQFQHLQKTAYVYLRQSTMGQVRFHQESTERQYALREKAIQMGWKSESIQILDADLGLSGTSATHREDFKVLVAEVSMNNVGAVFALEASRLSRSNADWYRLIELCSLTNTLIIDEDGCYNPSDFNDQLILGLKGTMSQAELHYIRARLQGGKLNKARKGELRYPLPVGYCCQDQKTIIDPDQEVQGVIRLLFEKFHETGSAYAVVRYFATHEITFPKRAYGGAWSGKLLWGRLSHGRVMGLLRNPCYTGAYVYGRYRTQKQLAEDGTIHLNTKVLPEKEWDVLIKDHHEAYITWEEYEKNIRTLTSNCTHNPLLQGGAAREGQAILQGLLLCSGCGRKLTVRYYGNHGQYPTYQCTWKKREGLSGRVCFSFRSDALETPIITRMFAVMNPEQINIALQAFDELQARHKRIEKQWQMRLAQAEYNTQLAQRRYEEVDPANRLVAATLEQKWNDALTTEEQVRDQIANLKKEKALQIATDNKDQLITLCSDLPKIWNSVSTSSKNKKRIIRQLIKDITVEKQGKKILLHVRWQGCATETIETHVPLRCYEKWQASPEIVNKVRELSNQYDNGEIANYFNQRNIKTGKDNNYTVSSIQWIRFKHKIPPCDPRLPSEVTVNEVMEKFSVSRHVVYYWIKRKIVEARKPKAGMSFYLSISASKESELNEWIRNSKKMHKPTTPPLKPTVERAL